MSPSTGALKSYAVPFNVHPPNVKPDFVGGFGHSAFSPYVTVCGAGTGVPPFASNVTVYEFATHFAFNSTPSKIGVVSSYSFPFASNQPSNV